MNDFDENEFAKLAEKLANAFIDVYVHNCTKVPKAYVLMAMTGALAACSSEAGAERDKVVAALNSAFDDIEAG